MIGLTGYAEGDRAVLHQKQPQLTKPLKKGDKTHLRRGHVAHDNIIGSRPWDAVQAHKGKTRSTTSC
jgi:tRNA A58 N-methylase Trm61